MKRKDIYNLLKKKLRICINIFEIKITKINYKINFEVGDTSSNNKVLDIDKEEIQLLLRRN